MVFDGSLLHDLLVQTPIVALLIIFLVMDRREHRRTVEALREQIKELEHALIDHMNRLAE